MRYFILVLLYSSFSYSSDISQRDISLFGRPSIGPIELIKNEKQITWLMQKRILNVGISIPDYPPFDMTIDGGNWYYEGLTADYLNIISRMLDLNVNLVLFDSRFDAINAIKKGEIDVLTTSNLFEKYYELSLSIPYINDYPSLYASKRNINENSINSIAIAYDYLPDELLENLYPSAKIVKFNSRQEAVASTVFGHTDAVIIDHFSVDYLVESRYSSNLYFLKFLPIETYGVSFAFASYSNELRTLFDLAIKNIPLSEHWAIKKRWSGGVTIPDIHSSFLPQFSEEEKQWLKKNSPIKIGLLDFSAPISYFDQSGNLRGVASDLLEVLMLYSTDDELKFEIIRATTVENLEKKLLKGEIDLALLTPTVKRERKLNFSKVVSRSPYVIMTEKNKKDIRTLSSFVLPKGYGLSFFIKDKYPNAKILKVNTYPESMNLVSSGKVDATVAPLGIANYYKDLYFNSDLKISGLLDSVSSFSISFASNKDDEVLMNIINKFLSVVQPDELKKIEDRWTRQLVQGQETWRDYKYTVLTLGSFSALFIILLFIWSLTTRWYYKNKLMAQRELENQLFFMQQVVDSIPHPIYVRDINGVLILCNNEYQNIFKAYQKEYILYKNISEGKHRVAEVDDIELEYKKSIEQNVFISKDRKITIDGREVNIFHWFKPYKNIEGNICGLVGGWIDINDRIKLLEDLVLAKNYADEASKAKSRFLAVMSHEIRTPINSIVGLLDLIKKQSKTGVINYNYIDAANQSASDLLYLIGDILDIAKIEEGKFTLTPKRFNLRETLESIFRVYSNLASQKGLYFALDIDELIFEDMLYDESRVKQVLVNIIGNAIKYTDYGSIIVKAKLVSKQKDKRMVEFFIQDTGVGIPKLELDKIFDAFSQAKNHSGRGGAGLGLMITKSICDLMGAVISIRSKEGDGTTITILIPFTALEDIVEGDKNIKSKSLISRCLNILIVDDYLPNRLLLCEQIKYLNHSVTEVDNAKDAFNLYSVNQYDFIITDCNMPDVSGYELCSNIRDYELKNKLSPIYIVGYTANAQEEVFEKCIKVGMNDCLFKPITIDDLSKVLNDFIDMDVGSDNEKSDLKKVNNANLLWFNIDSLKKITNNNNDLILQLLEKVFLENKKDVECLIEYAEVGDVAGCKSIIHKFKGASKIIGSEKVLSMCLIMEVLDSIGDINLYLNDFLAMISKLNEEIHNYLMNSDN
ncbi:transporter substrate-binding domain-containing protein [Vibrio metschnikovii]